MIYIYNIYIYLTAIHMIWMCDQMGGKPMSLINDFGFGGNAFSDKPIFYSLYHFALIS